MFDVIKSWIGHRKSPRQLITDEEATIDPWMREYTGIATEADIFHCFRLLLGRHPHREEWTGHAGRAGEGLDGIVAGYLRSLEFDRRGLLAPRHLQGLQVVSLQGFQIHVAPDDSDVGSQVAAGSYEPDVTAVFRRFLRSDMGVIDIGANIGYFTMLSASLVGPKGHVLAVEPNPRNARMLEASRRLNGFAQITVAQVAAGRATELLALHTAHSNGTTSPPSEDLDALLGAVTVPCLRIDDLANPAQRVGLIKLDVEGAEYNAMLGCEGIITRERPIIISEFSPDMLPGISGVSGPDYLRWLIVRGYRIGCIRPDGSVSEPGQDPDVVMAEYEARQRDHIDIVATPN